MTPTTCSVRKQIGEDTMPTPAGPRPYRLVLSWFTALVNHMGTPALSAPLPGTGSPPVALQLIAPWWQEHRLLELAAFLENQGVVRRGSEVSPQ
ncbi:MAG: hypothetical protein R3246_13870 [Acidimicrobiia bacterium]|nr:hypothetical protein [Acidimicrobiia bacterium]